MTAVTSEAAEGVAEWIEMALRTVIDPEIGYNIVDLGLVYSVAVADDGDVRITMTTTTRGCPATDYLTEGASNAAWGVPGVKTVDIVLTYDPPWSTQMMTRDAKAHLGISDGEA
ncbi:MAG: metal-sulfur cluster assembly factor [Pseudolabrys sp.]|nr:metal-sulfur cluster assembly factor [Pseudolabrys sp.]